MHRRYATGCVLIAATLGGTVASGCGPTPPSYPYYGQYGSRDGVIQEAQRRSTALETYVKDYLDGRNTGVIPANLIPEGRESYLRGTTQWKVVRESEIDPAKQWVIRKETPTIDWNASYGYYPDPHTTYFANTGMVIPFGSRAIITGKFPKARYFSIQANPAFQPELYSTEGPVGPRESTIVDTDIDPDWFNENPFRVGANRNATARNYTVTLEARIGNSAQIDGAHNPPFRRGFCWWNCNVRSISGITFAGPSGDPNYPVRNEPGEAALFKRNGLWNTGLLYARVYAPDKSAGWDGGAGIPKVVYQLPDGRRYFIQPDLTAAVSHFNTPAAVTRSAGIAPPAHLGPTTGWRKMFSILRSGGLAGSFEANGWSSPADKKYLRDFDRGYAGQGEDLPAPQQSHSHGGYKSLCTHCQYLLRDMTLEPGKVAVLTGRLPTTPKTRNGESTMTAAQQRYVSFTTYDAQINESRPAFAMPISSLMDDEIKTDANGYFTIVYSRAEDRPANATLANGVTWVPWGPKGDQVTMFLRYIDVGDGWTWDRSPQRLGKSADWTSDNYDVNLVGLNNRTGFMGEYLPNVHYLTKDSFQGLGTNVRWNQIPTWR